MSKPHNLCGYYDKLLHVWTRNTLTHFIKYLPCVLFLCCMLPFSMSVTPVCLYSTHHHDRQSSFFLSSILLSVDGRPLKLNQYWNVATCLSAAIQVVIAQHLFCLILPCKARTGICLSVFRSDCRSEIVV